VVDSDIIGGPKFKLGGPAPPERPWQKNFCTRSEYFTTSNSVFNFNFLALAVSDILGGPKFTLRGPAPYGRPLAEKL